MTAAYSRPNLRANLRLYPWYQFLKNLIFWQATWFLFFQQELSAAEAILLYVIYDLATTTLEVPSGYMSDKIGRRFTLIASAIAGFAGAVILVSGSGFAAFALAQVLLGASAAFASGTDSALLYESLAADGHTDRLETEELRAWRWSFSALAVSAVTGGVLAFYAEFLPFAITSVALAGAIFFTFRFAEPPHKAANIPQGNEVIQIASLKSAFAQPVLVWLFCLSVLMYGFSHVPYIFGQPFILEALHKIGYSAEAPLVSGTVSGLMMMLSVLTSLAAPRLRARMGLARLLMLAFGIQIGLIAVLALTDNAIAIAVLFLRMVPDSLSWPFIVARIQPLLSDNSRATFLSLQSFAGRLLFAASLWIAAGTASDVGQMPYEEIRQVLGWYAVAGLLFFTALGLLARRVPISPR